MKKKLLFVIDSLTIGGAEKSLVSLLNLIDSSIYEIDLLLFKRGGDFEKYVPHFVNIIKVPQYFSFLNGKRFSLSKNIKFFYYRLKTSINLRWNNYQQDILHSEQVVYKNIKNIIDSINKNYDIAIAYSQGLPTYYVANKVKAKKKFAWINIDYITTLYDKDLDFESYKKINKIVTVSEHTRKSVSKMRPEYSNNVEMILDIVNPVMINKMASEQAVDEFDKSFINILTVGRLAGQKAYDKAIEVAKLLKEDGYKFKWYGVGEGQERQNLENLIEKNQLNDCFILLGKKFNPYIYMKNCDIYVQTSIKEGFGLTVSEAKILKKPIVCTCFPTAYEIIKHEVDGLIVEHDVESIYNGVKKYLDEKSFREKILKKLEITEPYSSVNQLKKFYNLIES